MVRTGLSFDTKNVDSNEVQYWAERHDWLRVSQRNDANGHVYHLVYVCPSGNIMNFKFFQGSTDVYEGQRKA